jgi:hypothetical protein
MVAVACGVGYMTFSSGGTVAARWWCETGVDIAA